jgi:phosphonate metabolism protein (transferase hexapeptide repeat family)
MTKQLTAEPNIGDETTIANVTFGYANEVGQRCKLQNLTMGDYSYICDDSDVINTTIGKFCSIAAHARINPGNHPMHKAALHHFTYRSKQFGLADDDDPEMFAWRADKPVTIGHDVWLGHGAVITAGVTIGNGAAIGANAVVTKDVQPYEVVGGVPAKAIRYRFSEDVRLGLEKIRWWDWEFDQLKAGMIDFRKLSAEAFVEKYS